MTVRGNYTRNVQQILLFFIHQIFVYIRNQTMYVFIITTWSFSQQVSCCPIEIVIPYSLTITMLENVAKKSSSLKRRRHTLQCSWHLTWFCGPWMSQLFHSVFVTASSQSATYIVFLVILIVWDKQQIMIWHIIWW